MKLITILSFALIVQVYASNGYAQSQEVGIELRNVTVRDALERIEKETGYTFLFAERTLDTRRVVSLTFRVGKIAEALEQLFGEMEVDYRIVDRQVILSPHQQSSLPQQDPLRRISGMVSDAQGEPIIGANVVEKGTNNGAVTDIDGKYALSVREGAVLQISYIGYVPKEVAIGRQTTVAVELSEDTRAIDEVVVIGYGIVKKSDLTGSVSSVKTAEIHQTPMVSIDQGLIGRASGVQVIQTSGMPGATASIRVRGSSSLQGGNEPLYVIDGFPVYTGGGFGNTGGKTSFSGLSTVNPSDIESIEILKDAAATAIYGARAANGVVLITTKSGTKGRDIVSFESSFGFSNVAKKIEVLNAQEYALLVNEAYVNDGMKPYYDSNALAAIASEPGTDWQDEVFRQGISQNYQISFAGGDNKTQYAISGAYYDQKGIVIESDFKRYSLRLNFDRHISETFTAGTHLSASHTITKSVATETGGETGVVTGALKYNPIMKIYTDEATGAYTQVNMPGTLVPNPVATAREQLFGNTASRLLGDIFVQWEILKDLKLKVSLGADVLYLKVNMYTPSTIYQSQGLNRAEVRNRRTINWLNENTLSWNKTFNDIHAINALAGYTMQRNAMEYLMASSSNFVNDVMQFNNLGAGSIYNQPDSEATQWSLMSYLARVNYTLKDRYLFSVNARIDGSSRFGANNKYGFFPSASAGWRISEESFMGDLKDYLLPNLKLRASYGFTGNTEIGVYESLATLASNSWVLGNQLVSGFFPNKIPNPDLKWERTGQTDLGIDIGLLDNRLRITADYYRKETTDLLYSVAIPAVSGYQTMLKNIGSLENTGYELSVESDNLAGNFRWTTAFNISFNHNKVLELGGESYKEMDESDGHLKTGSVRRLIVGEPVGVFYGYRFDGIFQNEEETKQQTASASPIGVGLRRYKDLNGDGKVDAANDREILGDANPDFFGGFTNTFAWKGFELSLFFQYAYGNEIFNMNAVELETPTGGQNAYREILNRWTPTNPSNIYPKATTNRNVLISDRFIEDGSYLKLKTLSLSYAFPTLKWKHLQGLRLYLTGQNLLTWTKYRGYDPEVSYRGASTLEQGEDFGGYPQSKTWLVGVKLDIK